MRAPILLVGLLLLSGCEGRFSHAKELVTEALKDPESAQFRNLDSCNGDPDIVLGEVNAKNAYGGYTGYTHFITTKNAAYLENDEVSADGYIAAMKDCTNKIVASLPKAQQDEFRRETAKDGLQ